VQVNALVSIASFWENAFYGVFIHSVSTVDAGYSTHFDRCCMDMRLKFSRLPVVALVMPSPRPRVGSLASSLPVSAIHRGITPYLTFVHSHCRLQQCRKDSQWVRVVVSFVLSFFNCLLSLGPSSPAQVFSFSQALSCSDCPSKLSESPRMYSIFSHGWIR
jgi:hypothetical protein